MTAFLATLTSALGISQPWDRPITQAVAREFLSIAREPSPASEMDDDPRPFRRSGSGTSIVRGVINDLDPNREVRGALWYGSPSKIGVASRMLRDPHVKQALDFIQGPLAAARWVFKPVSRDPLDVEVADFLTWCLFEQLPWDQLVREISGAFMANGFALYEPTDDIKAIPATRFPRHPGGGRGLVTTGLHEIPASTVTAFHPDPANPAELAGITQTIGYTDVEKMGDRYIPADRVVRFTLDQEGANFTGSATLRPIYQPWKLRLALLTLDAIKHERTAIGVPVITLGEDATDADSDAATETLAAMRAQERGFLTLPHGYEFRWEGSSDSNGSNIELALSRVTSDITWAVGAGYMRLGQGQGASTGSYALGSTQQTPHHLSVDSKAKFISACLSVGHDGWSLAERLVRANYGDGVAVPRAQALNLPTRNWAEIAATVFSGVSAGVITADDRLEDAIRDSMELPPRDVETSRRGASVDKSVSLDVEELASVDTNTADEAPSVDAAPADAGSVDGTTAKEDQTIFGYHLQYGVAEINEARRNLGLPDVEYGNQTVPQYLAALAPPAPAFGGFAEAEPAETDPTETEPDEDDTEEMPDAE